MRRIGLVLLVSFACASLGRGQTPPQAPPSPVSPPENLVTFDYRQAELRWEDGGWAIAAGNARLKEIGNRPIEAQEVLQAIQQLQLTQHGTIGSPRPVMEYWLADGKAPEGLLAGQRLSFFDPETLRVEQIQGHWCVRDANKLLFAFGNHPEQAQLALDVIHRYHFNEIGYIGQPVPDMILFLAGATPPPAPVKTPNVPGPDKSRPLADASGHPNVVYGSLPGQPRRPADGRPETNETLHFLLRNQVRQLDMAGPLLPDASFLGDRIPFDWHQVQVRRQDRDWVLANGGTVLANFGANEYEARRAMHAVEYYRFTEQRRVGSPNPVLAYFLTDGRAPRGLLSGVPTVSFHPDGLTIRQFGTDWAICDNDRVVLSLHGRSEDAQQVLQIIRQEQFDSLCQVGATMPASVAFFVRSH